MEHATWNGQRLQTTVEVANAILDSMRQLFEEQNRQNDLKFATKVELNEVKEELSDFKQEFIEFRHDHLTGMDALMTELKAMREEQTGANYRQSQHSDQLQQHEIRITAIEDQLELAV